MTNNKGWVVQAVHVGPTGRTITSYWYGPTHGWGTTSGLLAEAAVYPTKVEAEAALRSVFRTPAEWKRRGHLPVRLAEIAASRDEEK